MYITVPTGGPGAATDGPPGQATWQRCRCYSPKAVPGVYGRLAWCRDGAVAGDGIVQNWFELLDRWFDTAGPDGGANGVAY